MPRLLFVITALPADDLLLSILSFQAKHTALSKDYVSRAQTCMTLSGSGGDLV